MTTTEPSTEQEGAWRTFFDDDHADLVIVAVEIVGGEKTSAAAIERSIPWQP